MRLIACCGDQQFPNNSSRWIVVNHQSQTSCMAALPWRCAHLQTARGTTGG